MKPGEEKRSREELSRKAGDARQLALIRPVEFTDGPERGLRACLFELPSGLAFTVLIDRGLDVERAVYKGQSLAWLSPAGAAHPGYFEPEGLGWLRTFPGGLLTTCGFTYLGAPCEDEGEALGLHGRASHLPARNVSHEELWDGDELVLRLSGETRESHLFGPDVRMRRTITARASEAKLRVEDEFTNTGFSASPFMLLYHINLGFPLVDEGTRFLARGSVRPRDAEAEKGLSDAAVFYGPRPGFKEQVFYRDIEPDAQGVSHVLVSNSRADLGLLLSFPKAALPNLVEWKMCGEGAYVLGVEPANSLVEGRAKERERGTLRELSPGERAGVWVEMEVVEGDGLARAEKAFE